MFSPTQLGKCKLQLHWDAISHLSDWWQLKSMATHSIKEIVGNRYSHTLLVGMETGTTPLEGILAISNNCTSI